MKFEKLQIKDICDFVGGSQPPKSSFINEEREGYIRLIQTRDYKSDAFLTYIPDNSTTKFCNSSDIMIGRYGPPIFQILRGLSGAYNVALLKAMPKQNIRNEYLYYFLKQESIFNYVEKLSPRTGGQTGVDLVSLNQYPILLPEIDYQDKVLSVLTSIDSKIELNNRINQELESLAKLIYDYWFVQFDFPDENGKPYKSSGGKMVYNDVLKKEIPDGWAISTIRQLAVTGSGATPLKSNKAYYDSKDIAWINSGEVNKSYIVSTTNFISQLGFDSTSTKVYEKGTILVAMYGATAGKVSYLAFQACTNQAICAITPNDIEYTLYIKYNLEDMNKYLVNLSSGSARDNLSQEKIKNLVLPKPDNKIIKRYHALSNPMINKILNNIKENQKLADLRDWLLPMLMNGQVTIK